jgi:hypothetical protein
MGVIIAVNAHAGKCLDVEIKGDNTMKIMITVLCLLGLICTNAMAKPLGKRQLHFMNQRGSKLTLVGHPGKVKNSGTITGTFTTAVGNCQSDKVPMPLTGYYNGSALVAVVNYPQCGAIAVITGDLDKHDNIRSLWMDVRNAPRVANKQWKANIIGADFYRKVNS